ncbi:MAG TPA: sensor histidine kinase [Anaeromyxobacteraceae bacterium]|nr:sensor histidine kinase [Anaeromyxobacteraceae bacterium]
MTPILVSLIEAMAVFLVISFVYCSSPALPLARAARLPRRSKVSIFVFFTAVTVMGTYLGIRLPNGVIANTRGVGSVLAGLLGGTPLGLAVGLTAGLHRLTLGGVTALSGCIGTTVEGLLGGLVRRALAGRPDRLMTWQTAGLTTLAGEVLHQLGVVALAPSVAEGLEIVKIIGPPMIVANTLGSAAFMVVFHNRAALVDRISAASSALALRIADRTLGLMARGYGPQTAGPLATIIREETGVGAVVVTDLEKVMAFDGVGSDHHLPGSDISSPWTRRALATGQVAFADGVHDHYDCRISPTCPLSSVVVVPLQLDGVVVGTVQLMEAGRQRFRTTNRRLGEGLGALLSSQLVQARYQEQKTLLVVSELKLLQAQVAPHFLFNALNAIVAVTRTDPKRARELLIHLSRFFRQNLKRSGDVSTLSEELAHVRSYLEIEKARFQDRLSVETDVDEALLGLRVPTFTLQPLIENAIKHGISRSPNPGRATIRAYRKDDTVLIDIEDDAGAYVHRDWRQTGLGMKIVDKRIKNLLGDAYGITVHCVPQELTRVTVRLPAEGLGAVAS